MKNIDYEKILDNLNLAVLAIDRDSKIVYVNKQFCNVFNTTASDALKKKIQEYIPENTTDIVIKDCSFTVEKTDDGCYTYIYLTNVENRLEKIYSDFISTVSHELRTPLTSIRGFADTMLMSFEKLEPEQIQKFLTIIKEQSNRLIKLVENLLSISKIQVQQSNLVYKSVNAKSQIEQAIYMIKNQYPDVNFDFEAKPDVQNILVDENKFQQILINLLDNASKYSYNKGLINVKLANSCCKENYVSIKIQDHGIGIEAKNLSKIFEKFSRIENHLTRKTQGSGLGLYIVKSLVDKMGGEIIVKSSTELPNSGTVFEILFPASSYTNQSKKILKDK